MRIFSCKVNFRSILQVVVANYKENDIIWIQDYHLLLVCGENMYCLSLRFQLPKMLRELLPHATIALFLHTPFPSSEIFRALPWREVRPPLYYNRVVSRTAEASARNAGK